MQKMITLKTKTRQGLYDITKEVSQVVQKSGVKKGMVNVFVNGATAGIMIQENWDESVQTDVINYLKKQIPQGVWEHDYQDGNGDAHIKSGLVGPSETLPVINGSMGLGRWQNIFLCEFDGPRSDREIIVTVIDND